MEIKTILNENNIKGLNSHRSLEKKDQIKRIDNDLKPILSSSIQTRLEQACDEYLDPASIEVVKDNILNDVLNIFWEYFMK